MSGMMSPVRSGVPSSGSLTNPGTYLLTVMGSDHVTPRSFETLAAISWPFLFEPEPCKSVNTSTSRPACGPARTTEIWCPIPNSLARRMKMARASSQLAPPFVVRVKIASLRTEGTKPDIEMALSLVAREPAAVPDRIHEVGVERVRGDRVLVVELEQRVVTDELDRRSLGEPAVGRLVDVDDRGAERRKVLERQRLHVGIAVRRDRDPWVRCAVECAARALGDARDHDLVPRACVEDRRDGPASPAVVPTALLVGADPVRHAVTASVNRAHRNRALDFAVQKVRADLARVRGARPQRV